MSSTTAGIKGIYDDADNSNIYQTVNTWKDNETDSEDNEEYDDKNDANVDVYDADVHDYDNNDNNNDN